MSARFGWLLGGVLLVACGNTGRGPKSDAGTDVGSGGAGGAEAGLDPSGPCSTAELPPAGLVRLSFAELSASLEQLLGPEAVAPIAQELDLASNEVSFPPLASPSEGDTITERRLRTSDQLAQLGARYVREHFELVTGCSADYGCVSSFVDQLAERAFRRPLGDEEQSALGLVVASAEALGAPPEQGAEYGVYAVLASPHFLYRTEFGAAAAAPEGGELPLTEHELASSLSFFVTGGPPDADLLQAAAAGELGSPDGLLPHVERLLAMPAARQHLQLVLHSYLGVGRVRTVVLDPEIYPEFNAGLAAAMELELDQLLEATLWSGPASALLTSRAAHVDQGLAAVYGVVFPPPGATLDESGFAQVELPTERAGLLTRAGILAARSRPEGPSVVGRGLWVQSAITCHMLPAIQETAPTTPPPADASEREKSELRLMDPACRACHVEFDAYGLALDQLDAIGRFRSVDEQGRPIDTAVVLPEAVGGVAVKGAAELSRALASEIFTTCLSQRFFEYALPRSTSAPAGCRAKALAEAGNTSGDASLSELIRDVALSRAFLMRKR